MKIVFAIFSLSLLPLVGTGVSQAEIDVLSSDVWLPIVERSKKGSAPMQLLTPAEIDKIWQEIKSDKGL